MEQSIGTSGAIIVNKISNSLENLKVIKNEADVDNDDLNSLAPFVQLLNQQITLLTSGGESVNELTNELGGTISQQSKDENAIGLLKQNQISDIIKALLEMKGNLPDGAGAAGEIDLDLQGELENKTSGIGIRESLAKALAEMKEILLNSANTAGKTDVDLAGELKSKISGVGIMDALQGIEKEQLLKNEDSKNNALKLSDQALRDNTLKILDNQTMRGNAAKLFAGTEEGKSIDALQQISSNIADKLKSLSKESNIVAEKYNQDISSNSVSGASNGMAKVGSLDDNSIGQIINRVVAGVKENASADGGRIKITLSPPSLGTLEMDVSVRNNKVQVIIVADNKDVQLSLNSHLDRLKGSLLNQGLTIDRCDVLMQNNREDYQQNFSQQAFYRDGSEKSNNNSNEKYSEELKTITPIKHHIISSPSFNSDKISIFA